MRKPGKKNEHGQVLITLIIVIPALVLMVASYLSLGASGYKLARRDQFRTQAQLAADAGADYGIERLNQDSSWTPPASETVLLTDSSKKMTYQTTLTNNDSSTKTLLITGRTYFPATSATPYVTVKIRLVLGAVTSGTGPSSVSTGVGGLKLNSNSKISGGDVVIAGGINMSNNAQIGLSTNPVNVRVADKTCPKSHGSAYPRVCDTALGDSLTDPITIGTNGKIYGNVQAKHQASGTNMFNPGLVACSPPSNCEPVGLPPFDRTAFKNTVSASLQTMTGAQASTCSAGQVNWPANVKINGSVTTPNNCTAKINGNVWITGSLSLGNNSKLAIQNGVGTTMPDIVVDGSSGFTFGNNSQVLPNSSNTGAEFLTFWNTTGTSCTPIPADCSNITGTNLYNSQNTTTINLSNNGSAPASVLYAYWSQVSIANNGQIGAVAGQTVSLGNNAVITFTASVPGSNNLVTTWVKRGYTRVF